MTNDEMQHPADERLLDATLEQFFWGPGVISGPGAVAAHEGGVKVSAVRLRWLQPAIFLLGLVITALLLWQGRREELVTAQNPAPFGVEVRAEGRAEIEALPDDVTNLTCFVTDAKDLVLLKRFHALRRLQLVARDLHIGKINFKTKHKSWVDAHADVFKPLADLGALESLTLPFDVHIRAAHLEPLVACAGLRELYLMGDKVPLTEAFVAGMKNLPRLSSLRFHRVNLDAEIITRLAFLELQELEVTRCPGFDAKAFAAMCVLSTLRSLSFGDLGVRELGDRVEGSTWWVPSAADFAQLKLLPKLAHVSFFGASLGATELNALPDTLSSLELRATELLPADYLELARFGNLRRLMLQPARQTFHFVPRDTPEQSEQAADAIATALAGMQLTEFYYSGTVTEPLLKQLGMQPVLDDLTLRAKRLPVLSGLATSPSLRSLHLFESLLPPPLDIRNLRELKNCRSLVELEVDGRIQLSREEIAAVFGDKVNVTIRSVGK